MAEMLVALWLSCCKPHSPGRVNPTFKPKPRYRQPGQQQWHISNYPKTKCPSFVCNPHSGNSASQHMELSLGGLEGRVEVVLCSHLTALDCLEELRWLVVKHASVINVRSSSWVTAMTFSCFSLCVCVCFTALSSFLPICRSISHQWSNTDHLVVGLQREQQLDINNTITYHVPVNPFLTSGTLSRGEKYPICPANASMWTQRAGHILVEMKAGPLI